MSTDYGDYTDDPLRSRPQVLSVKNDNPSPRLCFVERDTSWCLCSRRYRENIGAGAHLQRTDETIAPSNLRFPICESHDGPPSFISQVRLVNFGGLKFFFIGRGRLVSSFCVPKSKKMKIITIYALLAVCSIRIRKKSVFLHFNLCCFQRKQITEQEIWQQKRIKK